MAIIRQGGGPNPPVRQGPFQYIKNVHWAGADGVFFNGNWALYDLPPVPDASPGVRYTCLGVEITSGGSRYFPGDQITINGGTPVTPTSRIVVQVVATDHTYPMAGGAGGAATIVSMVSGGEYLVFPPSPGTQLSLSPVGGGDEINLTLLKSNPIPTGTNSWTFSFWITPQLPHGSGVIWGSPLDNYTQLVTVRSDGTTITTVTDPPREGVFGDSVAIGYSPYDETHALVAAGWNIFEGFQPPFNITLHPFNSSGGAFLEDLHATQSGGAIFLLLEYGKRQHVMVSVNSNGESQGWVDNVNQVPLGAPHVTPGIPGNVSNGTYASTIPFGIPGLWTIGGRGSIDSNTNLPQSVLGPDGSNLHNLCIEHFWNAPNAYLDWGDDLNVRSRFQKTDPTTGAVSPIDLGPDGGKPGVVPLIYCAGGPDDFPLNRASGNRLSLYGAPVKC
jgi:hypothetical protein